MTEDFNNNPKEDSLQGENAAGRQSEHRMRRRIPKVEKVDFNRGGTLGDRQPFSPRDRYSHDSFYERRPSYQRPSYYDERGSAGRRPYMSDRRPDSRYHDNDEMQYTNNLRTYHDAGVEYPQRRRREDYGGREYSGSRNYNMEDGRRRGPRVAYAKGNYPSRPVAPKQAKPKPQPKKKKKSSEMQIPAHVVRYKDLAADPETPIRLNRFLANAGVCSRRDADTFIQVGLVKVNDTVVTELGTKVMQTDEVKFKNRVVKMEDKIYVLLNKPKGYITTCEDPQNRKTVMDLVRGACTERIYSVGRLDRNTTGVLLLTNDGELASRLTHPQYLKKKIYHVFLDKEVTEEDMEKIRTGVTLDDGEIKADAIEYAKDDDKKQVGIESHSGKNRVVRRIFETLGYHVAKLDRVYFAGLTKKNLRRGAWRYLTADEVSMLKMGAFE